MNSVTCYISR